MVSSNSKLEKESRAMTTASIGSKSMTVGEAILAPLFLVLAFLCLIGAAMAHDTAFAFPYDTFIAGIFGRDVSVGTALFVYVDDTGKLGTNLVDANGNKVATPQAMLDESVKQQKRIAELEGTVERLAAMVKEQAAQIQKVSAELEMSKPAARVVVNKP